MKILRIIQDRLAELRSASDGLAAIETAIIAPTLVLAALGTFDISRIVARQHELQIGATDVEGIILAQYDGTTTDTSTVKATLASTLNISQDKVTVSKVYRCNYDSTLVTSKYSCDESDNISTYVKFVLTDTYTPMWTIFGVGGNMNYNVTRTVQIS